MPGEVSTNKFDLVSFDSTHVKHRGPTGPERTEARPGLVAQSRELGLLEIKASSAKPIRSFGNARGQGEPLNTAHWPALSTLVSERRRHDAVVTGTTSLLQGTTTPVHV